jgi:hypothetical protein
MAAGKDFTTGNTYMWGTVLTFAHTLCGGAKVILDREVKGV